MFNLISGFSAADVPIPQLNKDQKIDWLRLIRTPNVGPVAFRFLINQYGGAKAALEALPELHAKGRGKKPLKICSQEEAEAEIHLARQSELHLIAMGEKYYPRTLTHIEQVPPLLYAKGDLSCLTKTMIGIVGSRNCSTVGKRIAKEMAAEFSQKDIVTVSGLARGMDGSAHEGAISVKNGKTVAVLAGGLNRLYPPQHLDLAYEIADNKGVLLSEMPPNFRPRGQDFPRRNRIISGLSLGIVVIEAAIRSGSLITARMASEQNRIVFAVPGSPLDPRAEGTNKLIREGAVLTRHANDVLEQILPLIGRENQPDLFFNESISTDQNDEFEIFKGPLEDVEDQERDKIETLLSVNPIDIDSLIAHSGLSSSIIYMGILELELAGRIERHPGGRISLLPTY